MYNEKETNNILMLNIIILMIPKMKVYLRQIIEQKKKKKFLKQIKIQFIQLLQLLMQQKNEK